MDYDKVIDDFAKLAQEYCAWAESAAESGKEETYRAALLVAKLYLAGLELPITESVGELNAPDVRRKAYKKMLERFEHLPFRYYFEVFHPVTAEPETPVTGDICDDLADIYCDLKDGLFYWENGIPNDAVFSWKCSFGFHWGAHATSALRALHCYETQPKE